MRKLKVVRRPAVVLAFPRFRSLQRQLGHKVQQ